MAVTFKFLAYATAGCVRHLGTDFNDENVLSQFLAENFYFILKVQLILNSYRKNP